MGRKRSLARWITDHVVVTDGPARGKRIRLEAWQRGFLRTVDREEKPIIVLMGPSQIGKTLLTVGVATRAAADGAGSMICSATDTSIRDLGRRLDSVTEGSPALKALFAQQRGGPGARTSWRQRTLTNAGWIALASAGSGAQVASRTAAVAVCDETSRYPASVRSGEGSAVQLLRMRISDYGPDGRLICISSPVRKEDSIASMYSSGDRRLLFYRCLACGDRTRFRWALTTKERGVEHGVACEKCGTVHGEPARKRMLKTGVWMATAEPRDPDVASFNMSRLDSARSSLQQIAREYWRCQDAAEQGDVQALAGFQNTVIGQPAAAGSVDVDELMKRREVAFDLRGLEQLVVGCDVQQDRLEVVVVGFSAQDRDVWILHVATLYGDPTENDVWQQLAALAGQKWGGMRPSVIALDGGFLTSHVRRQASLRRGWYCTVGRAGVMPIARPMGSSGICVVGTDEGNQIWSNAVAGGRVRLSRDLTRRQVQELAAAEALTATPLGLRWRRIPGVQNHGWDACRLSVWGRRFLPRTSAPPRPVQLRAV